MLRAVEKSNGMACEAFAFARSHLKVYTRRKRKESLNGGNPNEAELLIHSNSTTQDPV